MGSDAQRAHDLVSPILYVLPPADRRSPAGVRCLARVQSRQGRETSHRHERTQVMVLEREGMGVGEASGRVGPVVPRSSDSSREGYPGGDDPAAPRCGAGAVRPGVRLHLAPSDQGREDRDQSDHDRDRGGAKSDGDAGLVTGHRIENRRGVSD